MMVEESGFAVRQADALARVSEGVVDVLNDILSGNMGDVLGMALVIVHEMDGARSVGKVAYVADDIDDLAVALRGVADGLEGDVARARVQVQ